MKRSDKRTRTRTTKPPKMTEYRIITIEKLLKRKTRLKGPFAIQIPENVWDRNAKRAIKKKKHSKNARPGLTLSFVKLPGSAGGLIIPFCAEGGTVSYTPRPDATYKISDKLVQGYGEISVSRTCKWLLIPILDSSLRRIVDIRSICTGRCRYKGGRQDRTLGCVERYLIPFRPSSFRSIIVFSAVCSCPPGFLDR